MAVHQGLGAAFVSVSAIEKELQLGLLARVRIRGALFFSSPGCPFLTNQANIQGCFAVIKFLPSGK